mgnify:CR=1 FL=1
MIQQFPNFNYKRYLPSAFDDSLTMYEVLVSMREYLNQVIDSQNEVVKEWNELKEWIDTQLKTYTKEEINKLAESGYFETLINDKIFSSMWENINNLKQNKLDKDGLIYPANLSNEVKSMITGGQSVPIVGENAVDTAALQNDSVTREKVNYFSDNLSRNLFDKTLTKKGGYYSATNGSWVDNADYQSTHFIRVTPSKFYYLKFSNGSARQISCWDASKKFVVGYSALQVQIPAGVEYIRVSVSNGELDRLMITDDENASYEKPAYHDEYLKIEYENLSSDLGEGYDQTSGQLVPLSVNQNAVIYDYTAKQLTIKSNVMVFGNSFFFQTVKDTTFSFPSVLFTNSTHGYLFFNKEISDFEFVDYTEFKGRKPQSKYIYLGVFNDSAYFSTIQAVESISYEEAKIICMTNNQAQIRPTIDYQNKKVVISPETWFIFTRNRTKQITLTEKVEIPYTGNYGYLCYDFISDKFSVETSILGVRHNGLARKVTFGFFNDGYKVCTFNGEVRQEHFMPASILGDSISTYAGWIPAENRTWYSDSNFPTVKFTWWYELMHGLYRLCVNNSWSGSRVTNTQSEQSGALTRVNKLHTDTVTPKVVFIELGTNDYSNNVQIGDFNGTIDENDDQTFANTYARVLDAIYKNYPGVIIYAMTIGYVGSTTNLPNGKNGIGLTVKDYNDAIKKVCSYFNTKVIDMTETGINGYNATTFGGTHPGGYGHKRLTLTVRKGVLENQY